MPIQYSAHARDKLRLLHEFGVNESLVAEAVKHPTVTYYDTLVGSTIAVKRLQQDAGIVVPFREAAGVVHVITVYYTTRLNTVMEAKQGSGRWSRLGQA